MEKTTIHRNIIRGGALLIGVFFFTLPLIECSQDTSLNATGLEIATSSGDLFGETDEGGNILAFFLLAIPIVLLVMTFASKSFGVLAIVSAVGVVFKVIFMIVAQSRVAETDGLFRLTGLNWLVLTIYVGLCVFTFYCKKQETSVSAYKPEGSTT